MKGQYFGQAGITHRNNFDALRILFAAMVIVTHSEVLTGAGDSDALFLLTGGQTTLSYLGVRGFFTISGYLVCQSLVRSKNAGDYFSKRALRIFPGLITMLLLIAFAVGPVYSRLSGRAYFSSDHPLRYFLSELRFFPVTRTSTLPGLFPANPAGSVVNGSLWTIWFEVIFYTGLAFLFFFRKKTALLRNTVVAGWGLFFIFFCCFHKSLDPVLFPFTGMSAEVGADLLLYFAAGSAAASSAIFRNGRLSRIAMVAGIVVLTASLWLGGFFFLRYLAWPMIVLGSGTLCTAPLPQLRRLGEPSFGMYIWAYPVQQVLVQELRPSPAALTFFTLLIVIPIGYASWHLIEKRCLRIRGKAPG